jgi:hypothetical protein
MLVLLSDTHGTDDHRLAGRTRSAVRSADVVAHAGDFCTATVLDSLRAATDTDRVLGVVGNNDDDDLRDRLPAARTFTYGGVRFAMTHRRDGGATGLTLFGRERGADVVVFGHSHRPTVDTSGPVALLNPGSHADPRRHRAAHAEVEKVPEGGLAGRLVSPDGSTLDRFDLGPGGTGGDGAASGRE